MKLDEQQIWRAIRVIFPEQRKRLAGLLAIAGISLVTGQWWEPYLNAFLARHAEVNVPSPNPTYGWILLVLGIAGVIANEALDRWPTQSKAPQEESKALTQAQARNEMEYAADKKTLEGLFSELHLPTLDSFIYRGKLSTVHMPALHYFFGLQGVVQASRFHVYDEQLKEGIEQLYTSLSNALSFGAHFVDTSNPDLKRFDDRRGLHADPQAEEAHEAFIQAVHDTETSLRALCMAVRSKYPDIDLDVTNRRALEDYMRHNSELEAEVSKEEFAVLEMIILLEERKQLPTLQNLSSALDRRQVDVRVALDKLIELGHVKHLYPGQPWQKYTALPPGCKYYVDHQDAMISPRILRD